jgi:hypothetical protein
MAPAGSTWSDRYVVCDFAGCPGVSCKVGGSFPGVWFDSRATCSLLVPDACMHVCFLFFCAQRLVRAGELLRDVPFRGGWMEELRSVREGVYPTPTCC